MKILFGSVLFIGVLCLSAAATPGQESPLRLAAAGLALIGGTFIVSHLIHR